ncbi:zinc-dependent alcohol dehydrogenase family protein [Paraburkholderia caballeronis]|uniref:NADPH:quinone reductase n=1 Tax=Paraburkholderia caballeronis TaxID=416943 RepID=A0A1H7G1W5_9BURK|nr:NAD(P)-dependent alcohol dehydrogenase [Paraburkholderia caballeronis]PXW24748.1 NADPH:quinone reductase-like Zn-dependent oxidoreductase [Paraburkholderia caballeronis]PXX00478.1 NADPH:quinone reductase-like Zn-dependent oxidoreductase [Paraburkholderia caballeronis]RAJ98541.1 NADPH:quinone reductase-like Zn-dependent oxidoreductase [Paraburkholderia caballeronis]SEE66410.1 NADPH:quinone reductase [Paraburkholderia caballeronis]SEK32101.1 NADPH:quinone reductase [Paraburkholderia caballero
MNETMKRWTIPALGLDRLALGVAPRPVPKAGEILVEIEAVSLNFRDAEIVENGMGVPLTFPFTPASEMAGRVIAAGDGVTRFRVGDRVLSAFIPGWIDGAPLSWTDAPTQGGPLDGMLAQYVAMPADWCVFAPTSLDALEASTLPVAGLTAWMALVEPGHLRAGQTVVVQGTGGVSLFAVQIAAASGASVIVTSSSDAKLAGAIELGAKHGIAVQGINRRERPDWQHAVLDLTGGRGADHILEMAGGDNLARSLQAIVPGGRISVIGLLESDRMDVPTMPLLGSRASIVGLSVGPRRALEDLVRMIDAHRLKPVIDAVYPFGQVPQAFEHLRRGAFGKIVVEVAAQS